MNRFKLKIWAEDIKHLGIFYTCFCLLLVLLGIMNFVVFITIMERCWQ